MVLDHELPWKSIATEDKNASDILVGLHFTLLDHEQSVYLRPMIEQHYLGNVWRIYCGLMWSVAPTPEQLGLHAVINLRESLESAGFKTNDSFLAWQWTKLYPRRRDFLLGFAQQPEKLMNEAESTLNIFLKKQHTSLAKANASLKNSPRSISISLDQLRSKRDK